MPAADQLRRLPITEYVAPSYPDETVGITTLGQALNRAMADSAEHRAAYERIYGVAWEPLPWFATTDSTELSTPHFASGTDATTRC